MSPVLIGLIVFAIILVIYVISLYNGLVTYKQKYSNAYAQIDVQLNLRYDLIPNLVETAKAFMAHEKETLERVVLARNQTAQFQQKVSHDPANTEAMKGLAKADSGLTAALGSFLAVSERYPELKANQQMSALMEELTSTENKVAFSRQAMNDAAMEYNTA